MTTETQRIPAVLWDSLQDVCFRHDLKFLQDVSRIIQVPVADLKRRILGTRGMPTAVSVESGPWWVTTQCPIMLLVGDSMWRRCGSYCEANGTCWAHRTSMSRRYNDPYFEALPKRTAFKYDGDLYWVSEAGDALDMTGALVPGLQIDLKARVVFKHKYDEFRRSHNCTSKEAACIEEVEREEAAGAETC
jgi:hypothetical protein